MPGRFRSRSDRRTVSQPNALSQASGRTDGDTGPDPPMFPDHSINTDLGVGADLCTFRKVRALEHRGMSTNHGIWAELRVTVDQRAGPNRRTRANDRRGADGSISRNDGILRHMGTIGDRSARSYRDSALKASARRHRGRHMDTGTVATTFPFRVRPRRHRRRERQRVARQRPRNSAGPLAGGEFHVSLDTNHVSDDRSRTQPRPSPDLCATAESGPGPHLGTGADGGSIVNHGAGADLGRLQNARMARNVCARCHGQGLDSHVCAHKSAVADAGRRADRGGPTNPHASGDIGSRAHDSVSSDMSVSTDRGPVSDDRPILKDGTRPNRRRLRNDGAAPNTCARADHCARAHLRGRPDNSTSTDYGVGSDSRGPMDPRGAREHTPGPWNSSRSLPLRLDQRM